MIVYLVETEWEEQGYYREALAGEDLHFVARGEPVAEEAEIVSVFINTKVDDAFLDGLPHLRLITTRSRAIDHIDLAVCRARGVTVCHVPEYGEVTVAEHTFALMLALSRRVREFMVLAQHSHTFSYEETRAWDLCGKTLGIIGMGRIGQRVSALARAFGMEVVANDRAGMPPEIAEQGGFRWLRLEELLAASHVITLHLNLTPETHHLLNRRTLALCRRGALIINTARGRLIETDALREALESGQIGGAGLDVLEEESVMRQPASMVMTEQILQRLHATRGGPEQKQWGRLRDLRQIMASESLLARPNVVFTPHVAFNSIEAVEKIAQETVRNIRGFSGGKPVNVIP